MHRLQVLQQICEYHFTMLWDYNKRHSYLCVQFWLLWKWHFLQCMYQV